MTNKLVNTVLAHLGGTCSDGNADTRLAGGSSAPAARSQRDDVDPGEQAFEFVLSGKVARERDRSLGVAPAASMRLAVSRPTPPAPPVTRNRCPSSSSPAIAASVAGQCGNRG